MVTKRKPDTERADRLAVERRSGGYCEVMLREEPDGELWRVYVCRRKAHDVHHIVKRSQGGSSRGPEYLIHLCRFHHDLTDAAYSQRSELNGEVRHGRLSIEPHSFKCAMVTQRRKR